MLTEDLHDLLERASSEPPFTPSMSAVRARHHQLRNRQRLLAGTSVVAIVAVIAGLVIGLSGSSTRGQTQPAAPTVGLGGRPVPITPAELVASYQQWGPTRGDLSNNSAFLTAALQEWGRDFAADPMPWEAFPGPRALTGSPRVLFAGRTPDGVAAVVDQPSHDPHIRLSIGVMVGTSARNLQLVYEVERDALNDHYYAGNQVGGDAQTASTSADPHVLSFATGEDGSNVVALPVDPNDQLETSTSHAISDGQIVRHWTPAPVHGGIAGFAVPAGSITDTLVRVVHNGTLVDQSPVLSDNPIGPPAPANLLSNQLRIDNASGTKKGGFVSTPTGFLWLRSVYGTPGVPYPSDPFGTDVFVSAELKGASFAELDQDWLPGDPAQTVVIVDNGRSRGPVQLLSHQVTNPAAELIAADRLPHDLGWFVVSGENTTITGYRTSGQGAWLVPRAALRQPSHPVRSDSRIPTREQETRTRHAAVLATTANSIQLRLMVNGHQKVVTRQG